ncbi:MAG: hypothetical protein ACTHJW_06720, partial [Streptosporangiaceae bacterium]
MVAEPILGPEEDPIEVVPVVVLSQVFPARPSSIPDIRNFVRHCLAESPLTDEGIKEVGETVFRALLDAAGPTGSINVAFRIFPEHVEVDVLHSDTLLPEIAAQQRGDGQAGAGQAQAAASPARPGDGSPGRSAVARSGAGQAGLDQAGLDRAAFGTAAFDTAGEANWLSQLGDDASGNPTQSASLTHEQVITDFLYSLESEARLTAGY